MQKTGLLRYLLSEIILLSTLTACSGLSTATPTPHVANPLNSATLTSQPTIVPPTKTFTPSATATATLTATLTPSPTNTPTRTAPPPTATPTFDPASWEQLPIIPTVSETVRQIYERGLKMGNDPHAFSKIGDCETSAPWFLSNFDSGTNRYSLGSYTYLQAVIQQFSGSYIRTSLAARIGFTAASVLNPIWADPSKCKSAETPLACEVRLHHPSYAYILLGTNDAKHKSGFETNMRTIIEYLIDHGVVPILVTKADNLEGDNSINITIARLAYEYDLPLWNFWAAVQSLPNGGLQEDMAHLTWAPNYFDNPDDMQHGWPVRNLTALQALDAVWRGATAP